MPPAGDVADYLGGLVAAEGYFGRAPGRFRFALALGATDAGTCELLASVLDVGSVRRYPRRKRHYDDEVVFAVQSLRDLVEVVVPFMDAHLPPSNKRAQYQTWRAHLLDYWENHAKRPRPCGVEGCELPRRARGLCRAHYYAAHGR